MSAIHKHVVTTGIGVPIVVIRDQQEVDLNVSAGSSYFLCCLWGFLKLLYLNVHRKMEILLQFPEHTS